MYEQNSSQNNIQGSAHSNIQSTKEISATYSNYQTVLFAEMLKEIFSCLLKNANFSIKTIHD